MKNVMLILIITLTGYIGFSQTTNLKEYKASNGITYKKGDKIKMARGSGINGSFVYLRIGGVMISSNIYQNQLPPSYAGLSVKLKKIKSFQHKTLGNSVVFTVGGGNITNFTLDIENAIATCEVEICNNAKVVNISKSDKYDQLAKLKKLLDQGILTKEEYHIEKTILLNQ